jgi:hypothetical protein
VALLLPRCLVSFFLVGPDNCFVGAARIPALMDLLFESLDRDLECFLQRISFVLVFTFSCYYAPFDRLLAFTGSCIIGEMTQKEGC